MDNHLIDKQEISKTRCNPKLHFNDRVEVFGGKPDVS